MRGLYNPRVRGTDTSMTINAYLQTPESIKEIPDGANVVLRFYGKKRDHPFTNAMENYILSKNPSLKQEIEIAKKLGPRNLSYEAWIAIQEWEKTAYGRFSFELEHVARMKYNDKYVLVSNLDETAVQITKDGRWKRTVDYSEHDYGEETSAELKLTGKELKELSEKAFEKAKIPLNDRPVTNENVGAGNVTDTVIEKPKRTLLDFEV